MLLLNLFKQSDFISNELVLNQYRLRAVVICFVVGAFSRFYREENSVPALPVVETKSD